MSDVREMDAEVAAVYEGYDEPIRAALMDLRLLILETADATEGVGPVEETLRWGQPSYLTSTTKSGSTIRLAPTAVDSQHDFAMYFICSTSLVDGFAASFGDTFTYEANRALLFGLGEEIPHNELRACVLRALTYHLNKV